MQCRCLRYPKKKRTAHPASASSSMLFNRPGTATAASRGAERRRLVPPYSAVYQGLFHRKEAGRVRRSIGEAWEVDATSGGICGLRPTATSRIAVQRRARAVLQNASGSDTGRHQRRLRGCGARHPVFARHAFARFRHLYRIADCTSRRLSSEVPRRVHRFPTDEEPSREPHSHNPGRKTLCVDLSWIAGFLRFCSKLPSSGLAAHWASTWPHFAWMSFSHFFAIVTASTSANYRPEMGSTNPTLSERSGLRANVASFTSRLREVGFYRDLSDAYVTQTVTPRYTIAEGGTEPKGSEAMSVGPRRTASQRPQCRTGEDFGA